MRPLASCLLILLSGADPAYSSDSFVPAAAAPSAAARRASSDLGTAATSAVVVGNCNDSGPGSLRDAYFNAVDGVTIDLTPLACSRITLTTGALTDPGGGGTVGIVLKGSGQIIDGNHAGRVLVHNGPDTLTIHDLSIINGTYTSAGYGGGCIYSHGDLILESSTVSDCSLTSPAGGGNAFGGAVYSRQRVVLIKNSAVMNSKATAMKYGSAEGGGVWAHGVAIVNSIVSGNNAIGDKAGSRGGGVFATYTADKNQAFGMAYSTVANNYANRGGGVYVYGDARLNYSTVSGNTAGGDGGGMYVRTNPSYAYTHTAFLVSTISGNRAGGDGGGLFVNAIAPFTSCTIAANYALISGGGVYLKLAPHLFTSTIAANNITAQNPAAADLGGSSAAITGSRNIIRASSIAVPNGTVTSDPKLGPLQDNGGLTFTQALLPGSPAIDKGSNIVGFATDQRGPGFPRVVGESADIGAFERQDRLFKNGFEAGP
jgi:hypothetical protein